MTALEMINHFSGLKDEEAVEMLVDLLTHGQTTPPWPWPGESLSFARYVRVWREAQESGDSGVGFISKGSRALVKIAHSFDPVKDHPTLFFELIPLAIATNDPGFLQELARRPDCDALEHWGMIGKKELARVRQRVAEMTPVSSPAPESRE